MLCIFTQGFGNNLYRCILRPYFYLSILFGLLLGIDYVQIEVGHLVHNPSFRDRQTTALDDPHRPIVAAESVQLDAAAVVVRVTLPATVLGRRVINAADVSESNPFFGHGLFPRQNLARTPAVEPLELVIPVGHAPNDYFVSFGRAPAIRDAPPRRSGSG